MSFYTYRWGFWIRPFGKRGICIKLAKIHKPLFSERMGYRKAYYFCGLRFEFLK